MGCKVLSSGDYRITCGFQSHQKRVRGKQHIYGVDIVTAKCTVCNILYSDSIGMSEIWNKDELILLALGANDDNNDGICD